VFVLLLSFAASKQRFRRFLNFRVFFINQWLWWILPLNFKQGEVLFDQAPVFTDLLQKLLQCRALGHSESLDIKFELLVGLRTLAQINNVSFKYLDLHRVNNPENPLLLDFPRFVLSESPEHVALIVFDQVIFFG
jgi:hypothetical protein